MCKNEDVFVFFIKKIGKRKKIVTTSIELRSILGFLYELLGFLHLSGQLIHRI